MGDGVPATGEPASDDVGSPSARLAQTYGVAHRPTREEILLVLDGELQITLDGECSALHRGDAVLVPAGRELRVDAGAEGASAWVTTTPGFEAVTADGGRISPPWTA